MDLFSTMMLVVAATVATAQVTSNTAQSFTTVNGQIYTPGLAIVDAPQPYTPEGGDFLQLALDVSGNGKLSLPPYNPSAPTGFYNMTAYLYSYVTGLNLTISNGTSAGWVKGCDNANGPSGTPLAGCQPIMLQEPGSTVKHVNFVWPACLVGDGSDAGQGSARGAYNVSLHQSFRLNGTDYFTIFDLPISVTNSIPSTTSARSGGRLACDALDNPLMSPEEVRQSVGTLGWQPWLSGSAGTGQQGQGQGQSQGQDSGETVVTAVVTSVVATATATVIAGTGQGTGLVPGSYTGDGSSGSGDLGQGYIGSDASAIGLHSALNVLPVVIAGVLLLL